MNYIDNKLAHIDGLIEGLELDFSTKEGKVIEKMLDVMKDMSEALSGLMEAQDDMEDFVEELDEELSEVQMDLYDFDEDDLDDELEEANDDELYEVVCPECGITYITDFNSFEKDDVHCPECGAAFHLEQKILDQVCEEETLEESSEKEV